MGRPRLPPASLFAAVFTFIHKLHSYSRALPVDSLFFFFVKRVQSHAVVVDPVLLLLVAYRTVHERAGAAGARRVLQLRFKGSAAVGFFGILVTLPCVQRAVSGTLGAGHGAVAVVGRRRHGSQRQLRLQEHGGYEQLREGGMRFTHLAPGEHLTSNCQTILSFFKVCHRLNLPNPTNCTSPMSQNI